MNKKKCLKNMIKDSFYFLPRCVSAEELLHVAKYLKSQYHDQTMIQFTWINDEESTELLEIKTQVYIYEFVLPQHSHRRAAQRIQRDTIYVTRWQTGTHHPRSQHPHCEACCCSSGRSTVRIIRPKVLQNNPSLHLDR